MNSTAKTLRNALLGMHQSPPPVWFMRQAGRYLPEYRALRAEAGSFMNLCLDPVRAAEVTLQPVHRFGMSAAILFSDILTVPFGLGMEVSFREGEGPALPAIGPGDPLPEFDPAAFADRTGPIMETVRLVKAGMPETTTSAWRPRSRNHSAMENPAKGASHCRPGASLPPATTTMQRSGAPKFSIAATTAAADSEGWPTQI